MKDIISVSAEKLQIHSFITIGHRAIGGYKARRHPKRFLRGDRHRPFLFSCLCFFRGALVLFRVQQAVVIIRGGDI